MAPAARVVGVVVDGAGDRAVPVGVLMSKDGGPVFPGEYFDRVMFEELRGEMGTIRAKEAATVRAPGMAVRDYFAAAALTGILANGDGENSAEVAVGAYQVADAMLAERDRSVRFGGT